MTYWLSVSSLPVDARVLRAREPDHRRAGADARLPASKRRCRQRLEVNARPENRAYKYDYFLDNCSTRVRDAIDGAVGGALRASARAPARLTLRGQALRMTADYWPLYVALDIVLGPDTDRPIDRWAEMFIPQELARGLAAVHGARRRPDRGRWSGEARTLFAAHRPPPLETPPARGRTFFLRRARRSGCSSSCSGWAPPAADAPGAAAARVLLGAAAGAVGAGGRVRRLLPRLRLGADRPRRRAPQPEHPALRPLGASRSCVLGIGVALGWPRAAPGRPRRRRPRRSPPRSPPASSSSASCATRRTSGCWRSRCRSGWGSARRWRRRRGSGRPGQR